ncbi:class I SAM-dependent methyltransferase [Streptomyces sp. ICBB 8177]|uniref:class I SAM-dependent DNA methyltransferase n=1 Tax=Streptomyces sp. ICBB 8177 TaxID=563922 RepID=UPI000D67497C|nr:class I SAM-dependent methyltransferase [Streptomyces sp. ICBB 8177]PWI41111.1 SAM-dependent methyltransferase [Streptomyces sp. ICBB 8177]
MTELPRLSAREAAVRASYDTVAQEYADRVPQRFAGDVLGRALLSGFAELVKRDGGGLPVVDAGCGPGHVTAHLAGLGLPVHGVDLSPRMVETARRAHAGLRFEVGSMTALDAGDASLAGVVAWWSLVHTPPEELAAVFAEFRRVLVPGGHVVVGFRVGSGPRSPRRAYGLPVSYEFHRFAPERVAGALAGVGLEVDGRLMWGGEADPSAGLLASRPT